MKWLWAAALLVMAAFAPSAQAQQPVRVGVLVALTGPLSGGAVQVSQALQIVADEINSGGGIDGRKIELVIRDTGGDPTKAVSLAQQLIFRENVSYIVGPLGSQEALAAAPVIANAGIPNLLMGTVDSLIDPEKRPLAIRFAATVTQFIQSSHDYIVDKLKKDKFVIFGDNTGVGTFAAKRATEVFTQLGAAPVATILVDPNKVDLADDIAKAKATGANAIFAYTAATGLLARLINAVHDVDWDVPIIGQSNLAQAEVKALLHKPEYWDTVYSLNLANLTYDAQGKLPEPTKAMIDDIRPKVSGDLKGPDDKLKISLVSFAVGYDMMKFIECVVKTGKDTSPESFKKVIDTPYVFKGAAADAHFGPGQRDLYDRSALIAAVASSLNDGVMKSAPGAGQ
jgi:branched-chain amino acid transport system substrate-binding protein